MWVCIALLASAGKVFVKVDSERQAQTLQTETYTCLLCAGGGAAKEEHQA